MAKVNSFEIQPCDLGPALLLAALLKSRHLGSVVIIQQEYLRGLISRNPSDLQAI